MAAAGILADVIGMRAVFALGAAVAFSAAIVAALLFRGAPVELEARATAPRSRAATSPRCPPDPASRNRTAPASRPAPFAYGAVFRSAAAPGRPPCRGYQPARQSPTVVDSFPITER